MRDEQQRTTTSEDRATQLLICEALSLAIHHNFSTCLHGGVIDTVHASVMITQVANSPALVNLPTLSCHAMKYQTMPVTL